MATDCRFGVLGHGTNEQSLFAKYSLSIPGELLVFCVGTAKAILVGGAIHIGSPRRLFKKVPRRQVRVGVFYLTQAC